MFGTNKVMINGRRMNVVKIPPNNSNENIVKFSSIPSNGDFATFAIGDNKIYLDAGIYSISVIVKFRNADAYVKLAQVRADNILYLLDCKSVCKWGTEEGNIICNSIVKAEQDDYLQIAMYKFSGELLLNDSFVRLVKIA